MNGVFGLLSQKHASSLAFGFASAVAAAIGLAGILKICDVVMFVRYLRGWNILPLWSIAPIAILLPATEVCLAVAWFLRLRPAGAVFIMFVFVLMVSAIYIVETVLFGPPHCGCMGNSSRLGAIVEDPSFVLGRNLAFLIMLIPSLVATPASFLFTPLWRR